MYRCCIGSQFHKRWALYQCAISRFLNHSECLFICCLLKNYFITDWFQNSLKVFVLNSDFFCLDICTSSFGGGNIKEMLNRKKKRRHRQNWIYLDPVWKRSIFIGTKVRWSDSFQTILVIVLLLCIVSSM